MASLPAILEKIGSHDKDFRYMATSDLLNELQKDSFRLDAEGERRVCQVVLKQLEDQSADVQNLAVKCLAPLLRKVGDARVEELADGLLAKLLAGGPKDGPSRETGALGLKTLLAGAPAGSAGAAALVRRLSPRLTAAVSPGASAAPEAVAAEALDVLHELLSRFGSLAAPEHEALRCALLAQLEGPRPVLRKRATAALGALAPALPDAALAAAADAVAGPLAAQPAGRGGAAAELARGRAHAAGVLLRAAGPRLGAALPALVPALTAHAAAADEADGELREFCLQALEAAAARCGPDAVAPHAPALTAAALTYLRYDPNLTDDMGDGGEGGGEEGEDAGGGDEEDDGDDGAYSDDEDVSWKVRRAAAKLAGALVAAAAAAGPEAVAAAFATGALVPALVARFREREESVRLDVIGVAEAAVRAAGAAAGREDGGAAAAALDASLPALAKAAAGQLGAAVPPRTRSAAFGLLRELAAARPGGLTPFLGAVVAGAARTLADKGAAAAGVKADALACLRACLANHTAEACAPHLGALVPALAAAAADRYYKTAAEALRCAAACVPALGAAPPPALAQQLYAAMAAKLAAADVDAEVKEAALAGMGTLLAAAGTAPGCDAAAGAALLLERARSESTRLAAVKALGAVAASPLPLQPALSPVAGPLTDELTAMLRKSSRALRQAALTALAALADKHAAAVPPASLAAALAEASALITDADLALASGALALCTLALARAPACAPTVAAKALPPALALLPSPLVAGAALASLRRFFAALGAPAAAAAGAPPLPALLDSLLSAGRAALASAGAGKHAAAAVAACVGAAAAAGGPAACASTAATLLASLRGKAAASDAAAAVLPLLCVGEIGRAVDLSAQPDVAKALLGALESSTEEAQEAAATALGGVARGNLDAHLPLLLSALDRQPQHTYELLRALHGALAPPSEFDAVPEGGAAAPPLGDAAMAAVLAALAARAEAEEDGVRAATSECLGCCVVTHPAAALPFLRQRVAGGAAAAASPLARAVAIHGARCALVERPAAATSALDGPPAYELLAALRDADHRVRHAAVQLLSAAAHYAPQLARPRLAAALPALLAATAPVPELVRTVDLGPFKHIVDDGLPLRTAAFECLATLLDACPAPLLAASDGGAALAPALTSGAGDAYDVKVGAHALLVKLAAAAPTALGGAAMEPLCEALDKTLQIKLKAEAVKQEIDRHEDLLRSALRAADALGRTPGAHVHPRFALLLAKTLQSPALAAKYAAVAAEHGGAGAAAGGDPMEA